MKKFSGFNDPQALTPIPDVLFRELLGEIESADELKVTLHALWRIGHMEGRLHVLRQQDFSALLPDPSAALELAVSRETLLCVEQEGVRYYFLNSPRGRASAASFASGALKGADVGESASPPERPNIFKLYEENIGPLTPLIADMLKDAESTYSAEWLAEALLVAVKGNKRNWRYVEAILKRWKDEGHAQEQAGRNTHEDGRRYAEGEYADYIEH